VQRQLEALIVSLDGAQSRLRNLTDKLADSKWNRRPAPGQWSAAECVEHLNITSRAFIPLLRDAIAEARLGRQSHKAHYRRDPLGWFMSIMMGPLRHIGKFRVVRVKTLPPFVPNADRSRSEILSDFVRLNSDLVSLLRSADGLPIDEYKIVSPFGGRMRYNAFSAFAIIARHEHRHVLQAEEAAHAAGSR
jgi:hypothetical protein